VKFNLIAAFLVIVIFSFGQSKLEYYGGVSLCNTNLYINNHQRVGGVPPGSPFYVPLPHIGVNRTMLEKDKSFLQAGISLAGRGAKDFQHVIYPLDTIQQSRLVYIYTPLSFNYRLIPGKKIYFVFGLNPGIKLLQNKDAWYPEREPLPPFFGRTFQLDYHLGLRLPLFNQFHSKVSFTRGIISASEKAGSNVDYLESTIFNYSFDFTLIYKL
jgi:hypothetical protein